MLHIESGIPNWRLKLEKDQLKRAFTLIELLVVIVIIALLAGLLMAVFSRARAKARQSECLSNLRQLGSASLLYAQDFRQAFSSVHKPSSYSPPVPYGIGAPAPEILYSSLSPCVKNKSVWFCLDDPYSEKDMEKWGVNHLHSSYVLRFLKNPFLTTQGENLYPFRPVPNSL